MSLSRCGARGRFCERKYYDRAFYGNYCVADPAEQLQCIINNLKEYIILSEKCIFNVKDCENRDPYNNCESRDVMRDCIEEHKEELAQFSEKLESKKQEYLRGLSNKFMAKKISTGLKD